MKRVVTALLAGALLLVATQPGLAGTKADPWRPDFDSPANFYRIQVDRGTPAAGVTAPIYADVHSGLPAASGNALHARFAR